MNTIERNRWLMICVALLIAGAGIGFGIAKLSSSPAAVQPVAAQVKLKDSIELAESGLQTMNIATESVSTGDLANEVHGLGSVTAANNGQAIVTARVAGTITRLNKRLGDAVKAGEVIALVASRDAAAIAAERSTAQSKLALARSVLAREQSLFEQKVTARQDFENAQAQFSAAQAEANRAQAAAAAAGLANDGQSIALTSPIAGRITSWNASLGAYVEPNTELFRVADPRFINIEVSVTAADAKRITTGAKAKVTTNSGKVLDATVSSVTPTLNEQTRAATVVLSLKAVDTDLTPGEFVQTRILTASNLSTIIIPDEAVQSINGHDSVFVRTDKGFKVVPVVVNARSGGRAAIASGLQAGEVVATKNAFLLKAEFGKGAEEEE